jgi:hypothetical protein
MAGKTSSSVGVGVAITLLSLTTLALFVFTAIFFGKYNAQKEEYNRMKNDTTPFITDNERKDGEILALQADARKANKSLVAYMRDRVSGIMRSTTGAENTKFDEFDAKVKAALAGEGGSLVGALASRDEQIKTLTASSEEADKARKDAIDELERTKATVADTLKALNEENSRLKTSIAAYEGELKQYRSGVDEASGKMTTLIGQLEADAAARQKILEAKISTLERENLVIVEQLAKLRGEQSAEILAAQAEEALVDAQIVGVAPDGRQVIINIGSKQKLPLGITFSVYASASQIKIDERTGEYRRGKATIEVINVGAETATCRINSETKGSPVVKGDVVSNAVYDPNKKYKIVVYGNFDANGDGVATPMERADIISLVEGWGAASLDELAGDVDFLLLGEKPILPPRPSDGSPFEVVQQYVKMEQEVAKYDEFYKSAQSTSVPILNQNRFMTLIGAKPIRSSVR